MLRLVALPRQALKIASDRTTWHNLGYAWACRATADAKAGDDPCESWAKAAETYGELVRREPSNVVHHNDRAAALLQLGAALVARKRDAKAVLEAAVAEYTFIIEHQADSWAALGDRGTACEFLGRSRTPRRITRRRSRSVRA